MLQIIKLVLKAQRRPIISAVKPQNKAPRSSPIYTAMVSALRRNPRQHCHSRYHNVLPYRGKLGFISLATWGWTRDCMRRRSLWLLVFYFWNCHVTALNAYWINCISETIYTRINIWWPGNLRVKRYQLNMNNFQWYGVNPISSIACPKY